MTTSVKTIIPVAMAALVLVFSACKKKDVSLGSPPAMTFKTGGIYTSANDSIRSGDVLTFGVIGKNNGSDDLASLTILISVNGQDFESRKSIKMSDAQKKTYEEDHSFKLVTYGTQKIKFIMNNTRGLETEKSLTFTVLE